MPDSSITTRAKNGNWIVIVMIALGVVAAAAAYIYWTNFVTINDGKDRANQGQFDAEVATKELAQLDDDLAEAKRVRRFNAMLDKARAFIARYPKFPPAYTLLAKVYIELNDWPLAYDELKKSLALSSNQPVVHRLAGTMQYVMRDYEKAEEHYRTAQVLSPDDPINTVYIAQVFIKTNRHTEAMKLLLQALQLDSKSHEAYATMCDLFMAQNDPTRALQQIDKALEYAATNERSIIVPYVIKRVEVLRRAGDAEAAMQTINEQLHDAEMFQPAVAKELADTWGMLGKPEKAAEFYERATAANPTEWLLHAGAVEWAVKAGDLTLAKQHLRVIEQLDPHLPAIKDLKERIAAAEKKAGGAK